MGTRLPHRRCPLVGVHAQRSLKVAFADAGWLAGVSCESGRGRRSNADGEHPLHSGSHRTRPPPFHGVHRKRPAHAVTVEGQRERKQVEREVNEFVFAVAVRGASSILHDVRSVRYNIGFASSDGQPITSGSLAALVGTSFGLNLLNANIPTNTVRVGTRLTYSAVRSLSSVIVVGTRTARRS